MTGVRGAGVTPQGAGTACVAIGRSCALFTNQQEIMHNTRRGLGNASKNVRGIGHKVSLWNQVGDCYKEACVMGSPGTSRKQKVLHRTACGKDTTTATLGRVAWSVFSSVVKAHYCAYPNTCSS